MQVSANYEEKIRAFDLRRITIPGNDVRSGMPICVYMMTLP
jgi:hypothetical protein